MVEVILDWLIVLLLIAALVYLRRISRKLSFVARLLVHSQDRETVKQISKETGVDHHLL